MWQVPARQSQTGGRGRSRWQELLAGPSASNCKHCFATLNSSEVAHTAAHTMPLAKFAITVRRRHRVVVSDIPLTSRAFEGLALKATVRNLGAVELMGEVLIAAIKKNMIQEILCEVPPSGADTRTR